MEEVLNGLQYAMHGVYVFEKLENYFIGHISVDGRAIFSGQMFDVFDNFAKRIIKGGIRSIDNFVLLNFFEIPRNGNRTLREYQATMPRKDGNFFGDYEGAWRETDLRRDTSELEQTFISLLFQNRIWIDETAKRERAIKITLSNY